MKISKFAVRRPVTIAMAVLIVLILGFVSLTKLPVALYPDLEYPVIMSVVTYSDAGPEEVEKLITKPLEGTLATIPGIKELTSVSGQGYGYVMTEFEWGTDLDLKQVKVREKLDAISMALPEDASDPTIFQFDASSFPIMLAGVSGDMSIEDLTKIVDDTIIPRIERIEGVASVDSSGGREKEVQIEADNSLLQAYGLSLSDISTAVSSENMNSSSGYVEYAAKNRLVKLEGEYDSLEDIKNTLIPVGQGGNIPLDYIADVGFGLEDSDSYVLLNGERSLRISIQKQSDANLVSVASEVDKAFEELQEEIPQGISIYKAYDQAEYTNKAIGSVVRNGITGALLAVVILYLFLSNMRSTIIIGTAIPISIIVTFVLLFFNGMSLNILTLGGLALGIGMMVDSSIVVLENIYRYRQEGSSRVDAAVNGTDEVSSAVIASTITTICVFLPIVFVEGLSAQLFRPLAMTVSFSLLASLTVSLTLVPMMSSKILKVRAKGEEFTGTGRFNFAKKISARWAKGFDSLRERYASLLEKALGNRKKVVFGTAVLLVISVLMLGLVGTEFMPMTDEGYITMDISMPNGMILSETERAVASAEDVLEDIPEIESVFLTVGSADTFGMQGGNEETNKASYSINLVDLGDRSRSTDEVIDEIREKTGNIAGADISLAAQDSGFGGGAAIQIDIKGNDLEVLEGITEQVADAVRSVEDTREVETSFSEGSPELAVKLDRDRAENYGVSMYTVSQAVRHVMSGVTASKYRSGGEEMDIIIQLPEEQRDNADDLRRVAIDSYTGGTVYLEDVADFEFGISPTTISRDNQVRMVSVTASTAPGVAAGTLSALIQEKLDVIPLPEGYTIEFGGSNEEMVDSFVSLGQALLLAVVLVYMVLASQFEALLYPFIIMFSIPPTLIGVVFGLLLMQRTFNVVTFIGVIMLAGIVVNNAIVLVDYINTLRKKGMERTEAILTACPVRLRPVIMTSMTTVLALLPAALGIGEGAETMAPMAVAVVFGLSFSSLVTLVFVPVVYSVLDERTEKSRAKRAEKKRLREAKENG